MKRIKTLKLIIALLLVINIGQVAFFLLSPRFARGKPARPEVMVQEHFNFDEAQMKLFVESRDEHRVKVRKLKRTLEELSISYYSSLDEGQQSTLLSSITSTTAEIYVQTHNHFEEIRAICKEDQLPKMDNFIKSLMRRENRKERPRPPRRELSAPPRERG